MPVNAYVQMMVETARKHSDLAPEAVSPFQSLVEAAGRQMRPPFMARHGAAQAVQMLGELWPRVRQRAGLKSKQASSGHLLVVDDGDAGALAATLERQRPGRSLHISLEVPQQPETQLWWAGQYAVRSRLDQLSTGPWDVRLASSPEWAPPTAPIPPLPLTAADGLVVVAVVRGWPLPSLERRAIGLGREARLALAWSRETRAPQKLALLAELLERFPTWEELFSLAQASLRGVD